MATKKSASEPLVPLILAQIAAFEGGFVEGATLASICEQLELPKGTTRRAVTSALYKLVQRGKLSYQSERDSSYDQRCGGRGPTVRRTYRLVEE